LGDLRGRFLLSADVRGLELAGALELVEETFQTPLEATVLPSPEDIRAVFDAGNGRQTIVSNDVAYDLEHGQVVRRLLFEPR
jgi:hypothetical protein